MITKECSLGCPYCLMNNRVVMDTIKEATLDEILSQEYHTFLITGGEPLEDNYTEEQTERAVDLIKQKHPNAKVYLYTNGVGIYNGNIHKLPKLFDGINISLHQEINYPKLLWIKRYIPIRLHRQEGRVSKELISFCLKEKIPLKIWVKDKCEVENEDRFILKGVL
jgi:hypothetical protein